MVPLMSEVILYEAILPTKKLILAFDAQYACLSVGPLLTDSVKVELTRHNPKG